MAYFYRPQYFQEYDWSKFYGNLKEVIPPVIPEPLGKEVLMRYFVDADHAGDQFIRRSRIGCIVLLHRVPIYWLSKRQNSVETSTFGSELMAMKYAIEYIRGLRYTLRATGISFSDTCFIYGDNQSVLLNTSLPE